VNPADPLADLKDIHLPPPISAWPPAPGWWLLAALLVIALVAGIALWRRHRRRTAYRRAALRALDQLRNEWQPQRNDAQSLRAINQLLKRTALAACPRSEVAALDGDAWLDFLDRQLRQPVFADPQLRDFGALYRNTIEVEPQRVFDAAAIWIRRHRCRNF
jgi:type II secretory pathway pseudopilin PulG